MIRWPVFLLLLSLVCLIACGGSKAPVAVTVDMERVFKESQQARKITTEVESFAKSVETQLDEAASQIDAASSDPKTDRSRVDYMKAQFGQMVRQAEEEVDIRRGRAEDEVQRKLEEALKILAKEKGWQLVIRKGRQSALWSDDALDQTALIIQKMDGSQTAAVPPSP